MGNIPKKYQKYYQKKVTKKKDIVHKQRSFPDIQKTVSKKSYFDDYELPKRPIEPRNIKSLYESDEFLPSRDYAPLFTPTKTNIKYDPENSFDNERETNIRLLSRTYKRHNESIRSKILESEKRNAQKELPWHWGLLGVSPIPLLGEYGLYRFFDNVLEHSLFSNSARKGIALCTSLITRVGIVYPIYSSVFNNLAGGQ